MSDDRHPAPKPEASPHDLSPKMLGLLLDARYLAQGGVDLAMSGEVKDIGIYQAQFTAIDLLLGNVLV